MVRCIADIVFSTGRDEGALRPAISASAEAVAVVPRRYRYADRHRACPYGRAGALSRNRRSGTLDELAGAARGAGAPRRGALWRDPVLAAARYGPGLAPGRRRHGRPAGGRMAHGGGALRHVVGRDELSLAGAPGYHRGMEPEPRFIRHHAGEPVCERS